MGKDREQLIRKIEAQIAVADEIGSDFITLTKGKGLNYFEEAHMNNIVAWTQDAIDILQSSNNQVK